MYSQPWSPTPSTTAAHARVAHAEALAGDAGGEDLAAGGAVEHGVADDGCSSGPLERRRLGGWIDDAAAGHALADVVVGFADQPEGHALGQEGAEALAGDAGR